MKKFLQAAALTALVAAGFGGSTVASAATVNCPGTVVVTDREFTLDTSPASTCLATGVGNISGSNDAINLLGYVTLDKSDDATTGLFPLAMSIVGSGTTSGTFSISGIIGFSSLVIAFKSGEGQLDPDWAAFKLAAGVLSGTWSISGRQSLSHVNLYGIKNKITIDPVPVPAGIILMLSGLAGLAGLARMRKAAAKA